MKATGIVRRIDELGRVVIPMEIRRTMKIREGDPLEIFTDKEGELILRKYSPMQSVEEFAIFLAEAASETLEAGVLIADKDNIIAVSGLQKKEHLQNAVSDRLEELMTKRKSVSNSGADLLPLHKTDDCSYRYQVIVPIIAAGDIYGAVAVVSDKELNGSAMSVATSCAKYLGKQLV